ncbi:MAG: hypothetical protein U0527_16045 [Candidatus Eisenbacteria bacterium]
MGREPVEKPLPEVVSRTRNPVQRAFHAVVSIAGWVLFGWFWWTVFVQPINREALVTFGLLLLALVAIVATHLLWVRFNVDLYRSRGQRTRVLDVPFQASEDQLGRRLVGGEWDKLQAARSIEVALDEKGETKTYRVLDAPNAELTS